VDLWCTDFKHFLQSGDSPRNLSKKERRAPRLKYTQYQFVNGVLFQKKYNRVLLRCLEKQDVDHVLKELYDGSARRNFVDEKIAHKTLRVGYY
jgi:hypothetical protein